MTLNALAGHRPLCKVYHERKAYPWLTMASAYRRATDEYKVPPLVIGIRAIRLSPYRAGVAGPCHTRLLTFPAFQPGSCSLALSGLGKAVASESYTLNSGPLRGQFTPCVPWRTISLHCALRPTSRNAPLPRSFPDAAELLQEVLITLVISLGSLRACRTVTLPPFPEAFGPLLVALYLRS